MNEIKTSEIRKENTEESFNSNNDSETFNEIEMKKAFCEIKSYAMNGLFSDVEKEAKRREKEARNRRREQREQEESELEEKLKTVELTPKQKRLEGLLEEMNMRCEENLCFKNSLNSENSNYAINVLDEVGNIAYEAGKSLVGSKIEKGEKESLKQLKVVRMLYDFCCCLSDIVEYNKNSIVRRQALNQIDRVFKGINYGKGIKPEIFENELERPVMSDLKMIKSNTTKDKGYHESHEGKAHHEKKLNCERIIEELETFIQILQEKLGITPKKTTTNVIQGQNGESDLYSNPNTPKKTTTKVI